MSKTYEQVHAGLLWERGKASDHSCACGRKAKEWAYQHSAGDTELLCPQGRRYSENLNDYSPMCGSCHRRLDHDPEALAVLAAKGRETIARLRESDPAWTEAHNQRSSERLVKARQAKAEKMKDPEFAERHRAQLRKGAAVARAAYAAQRLADPSAADPLREGARKVLQMRRTCAECDLTTNPASLGYHQKTTGHRGYTSYPDSARGRAEEPSARSSPRKLLGETPSARAGTRLQ